jgi:Leucine-rich repeat (LRR) protein
MKAVFVLFFALVSKCEACNIVNITGCEVRCDFDYDSMDTGRVLAVCENRKLKSLPSGNRKSLCVHGLKVEKNDIKSIGHIPFTCLQNLFLGDNNIHEISSDAFDDLSELTELSLISNQITSLLRINFTGVSKLKMLYLDHNPLGKLYSQTFINKPFAHSLEILSLSNCSLRAIEPRTFAAFSSLEFLNVSHNNFVSIADFFATMDAQGLPNLEQLDLSYNGFDDLGTNYFARVPAVKRLFITNNKLVVIRKHNLAGLETRLSSVYLNHNRLTLIESESLKDLSALIFVDLSCNSLKSLAENVFSQRVDLHLRLHNNPWQCSCDIQWMTKFNVDGNDGSKKNVNSSLV